ncbi:MAG: NAD-dependent DNA ligase LigA, partial [Lentisphaerae bacterium]|nr:NAD-dependent DNA ligase LigA [Lentisphaerota bacterium]
MPAKRAQWLRAELDRHNRLYYVEARPEISDRDYDQLYSELADIEERHPELASDDSPTRRVGGAPLKEFTSVRHASPMLSLDNTYSREELLEFLNRIARRLAGRTCSYVVEPKIDGVAVTVRYKQGRLEQGCTRGNGEVGDDITANLRVIRSIPLRLAGAQPPPLLEVRGEVFMPRDGFAELNRMRREAGATVFANPRNAAAGSLKLLDSAQVARRPLAAVFYGLGAATGAAPERHGELLEYLRSMGLPVPPRHWICAGPEDVLRALDELQSSRDNFPFETDGGVVKVDERELYEALGMTAKSPRWAVAFKFEPERAVTRLRAITVQVGRTGVLTPVAELEPVALAGSTINRATLHNADDIKRRDIRVGDLVTIEKAGEVIPVVTGVDKSVRDGTEEVFAMPGNCPSCGGAVTR